MIPSKRCRDLVPFDKAKLRRTPEEGGASVQHARSNSSCAGERGNESCICVADLVRVTLCTATCGEIPNSRQMPSEHGSSRARFGL